MNIKKLNIIFYRNIKNGPRARKSRAAVQRAPSRLYRTIINGPIKSSNKIQCIGPEFVVRATQPAKLLTVGDPKVNKYFFNKFN